MKPSKATLLNKDTAYPGHISTPQGLRPTDKHMKAIRDMPPPSDVSLGLVNKSQLRSFIGLVKYVRRYIKGCGLLCGPLNQLLKDDSDGIWRYHRARRENRDGDIDPILLGEEVMTGVRIGQAGVEKAQRDCAFAQMMK